ncbi:alpha-amylase family protein [Paludibaculum fermentans]|uniref:Beta-galactosidase trimerisation domain-containing protein n=1 Tax=Paludibaculum fermentans TaxID=1473598 RepID=A0A7S7NQW6_PALFE|nr:hypothetical protein [Paludibaculum fermentans]QOY88093.1 hypothetical protein IRI77_36055 [Paludibaculum fermentans]
MLRAALLLCLGCALVSGQPGWWMNEPIRWVQTNLRETDAAMDTGRLARQLAEMRANVVLMGMGGICAYYPTKTEFHYPSAYLPAGKDMFGDILREAHARHIRVVGRYDFSKTQKAVYEAHPEWFFQKADGSPVVYNGLYSTCINGGYYRGQVMKILAEGLEKYDVDGLFFNMFGNQPTDYSGNYVGLCHCDACRKKYRDEYHREIPEKPDEIYREFLQQSAREVSQAIGRLIGEKRERAGYFNYMQEFTDGIMSESNTAVNRPLPLWPYATSDNVNRARNSQPDKMAVDLNMQFVDYAWRFATVPPAEIARRMWQALAHGGALTFEVNGTLDLQDRQAYETARPIFQWAAAHEREYLGLHSEARVLLLTKSGRNSAEDASYRGLFRLLSEEHIPFAVSNNLEWIGAHPYDLVIASDWAPSQLKRYVEQGGRLLLVSSKPPEFEAAMVVGTQADVKGYVRVRDHSAFPSLKSTDLLMLNGGFTQLEAEGGVPLTLVPPSMIGPPEKIHVDMKDTDTPAVWARAVGRGRMTWLPWNLGALYYRLSLPAHAALFRDLVSALMPKRQLVTNAHPLVEMTLMEREGETQVHLINLSGHSQTATFEPIPMQGIEVAVEGVFRKARTVRGAGELKVSVVDGYTRFAVPRLADYELVVLFR